MVHIPLPKNPWLRRRRLSGCPFEVERLYIGYSEIRNRDSEQESIGFLASEYARNRIYYSFIRFVGLRRLAVYFGRRYDKSLKETKHA